jgi:hypothetical protein
VTNSGSFTQSKPLVADTIGVVTIKFTKCETLTPGCTVTEPIEVKNAKIKIGAEEAGEKLGINFKPEVAGGVFTEITLKGEECVLAGKSKITGELTCHLHEFLQDDKEKELLCLHTDKGLKFGPKEATFELNDLITLTGHEFWSFDLT